YCRMGMAVSVGPGRRVAVGLGGNVGKGIAYVTIFERKKPMSTLLTHPYIVSDERLLDGEPVVQGTKTTVRAIVELWRLGTPPEEIPYHLPHLQLAQVFDALSYYSDHQEEINQYIERNRVPDHLVHPSVRR
ncbi:MAG TPA: DUF433 domain-containing protein, partial [Anaerolineales bacterium]|nr:DUF433 domain-containing protein [Anaerolineales bacterium]